MTAARPSEQHTQAASQSAQADFVPFQRRVSNPSQRWTRRVVYPYRRTMRAQKPANSSTAWEG